MNVVDTATISKPRLPGDAFATDNGTPDPSWFWTLENGIDVDGNVVDYFSTSTKSTDLTAVQLDFVWGPLLANSVECSDD